MDAVIGQLLPLALGVAISPVPVIAVILMLLSPNARLTSLGFAAGWVVGVALVVSAVSFLVDPVDDSESGDPSSAVAWLTLALGVAAVLIAVRQWRSRPRPGEEAKLPAWMAGLDTMTPVRALGLGFLLAAVNPKNLTLCLAGGMAIGSGGLTTGETLVAIAVFVTIGSVTVVGPVLGYVVAQARLQGPLDGLRVWLTANNATVMSVLMLVIGAVLIGKSLPGLF